MLKVNQPLQFNIGSVRDRIRDACLRINRDPGEITIVGVSKGRPSSDIAEAVEAGLTDIGENRVQEALVKFNEIRNTGDVQRIKWHMIGHLQTNKVKDAVGVFDLVESVDSLHLARQIDRQAQRTGKIQNILIQINVSGEATKYGFTPDQAQEAIKEIAQLKNINVKGLMTIALATGDPEKTRPCFRLLRELRDKINKLSNFDFRLSTLSMGMTDDFQVAIEEGSNMVRLGRAIFNQ